MNKRIFKRFALIGFIIMFASSFLCAQTFEKVTLHGEGDDKGKIIITIVGDGYKQSEIGTIDGSTSSNTFLPKAVSCKNVIMKFKPFSTLSKFIKIYAINVYQENGSFFEVTKTGTTQYPSANGVKKLNELINQYVPTTALKIVVTKTVIGGDCARPGDRTACIYQPGLAIHEIGHAMANLGDEDTRTSNLFERPNLTANSDQNTVRWKNFIGIDGITVKQKGAGAAASWYVPGVDDFMGGGSNFHIVNSAAIIESATDITGAPFYGTLFNGVSSNGFVNKPLNTETTINFPSGWGFIYDYAFHGCDKLQTLTIPADVKTIGQYAFLKCTGLTNITAGPATPPTINSTTFYGVTRSNITLTIPTGTRTAYENAGWTGFNIVESGTQVEYFEVTLNANGGSVSPASLSVIQGGSVNLPEPTKTDFTFNGWFTSASGGNKINSPYTPSGNITLYAQWTEKQAGFTVTFDSQGGTDVSPIEDVASGSTITEPTAPTRNGYDFKGWYKEAECENKWDFANDVVTGNITLFTNWEQKPKVDISSASLYLNKTTWDYTSGDALRPYVVMVMEIAITPNDYTVSYRDNLSEAKGVIVVTPKPETNFIGEATAEYTITNIPANINIFTVSFDFQYDDLLTTTEVEENSKVLPPDVAGRDDYIFVGWFTEEECENLWDFDNEITENITLYAGWNSVTTPIKPADKSNGKYGIKFAENIVSDKAEINVILPNNEKPTETKIAIYDMTGNVVFVGAIALNRPLIWDLRNTAGRTVANGTYLVVAEAKGQNGQHYRYSAKLGVKR